MDWWEKLDTGKKAGSIISVCCLGLLIIGGIAGMMSPDNQQFLIKFKITAQQQTLHQQQLLPLHTITAISESHFLSGS